MKSCETVEKGGIEGPILRILPHQPVRAHMPYVPCRMEYPLEENPFVSFCENVMHNSETLMDGIAGRPRQEH